MTWLTPHIQINEEVETLAGQKLYTTHLTFNTTILLQNWPDRFIITVRLFGFGFTKVFKYD